MFCFQTRYSDNCRQGKIFLKKRLKLCQWIVVLSAGHQVKMQKTANSKSTVFLVNGQAICNCFFNPFLPASSSTSLNPIYHQLKYSFPFWFLQNNVWKLASLQVSQKFTCCRREKDWQDVQQVVRVEPWKKTARHLHFLFSVFSFLQFFHPHFYVFRANKSCLLGSIVMSVESFPILETPIRSYISHRVAFNSSPFCGCKDLKVSLMRNFHIFTTVCWITLSLDEVCWKTFLICESFFYSFMTEAALVVDANHNVGKISKYHFSFPLFFGHASKFQLLLFWNKALLHSR